MVHAEVDAAGDGGMIVEEKDLYGIGVGVDKCSFTVVLEGLRAGLAGIGNEEFVASAPAAKRRRE